MRFGRRPNLRGGMGVEQRAPAGSLAHKSMGAPVGRHSPSVASGTVPRRIGAARASSRPVQYVGAEADALVFTSPEGHPLRRTKFRPRWAEACRSAGVTGLHFEDLRCSGATWATVAGATLPELTHRLGSPQPFGRSSLPARHRRAPSRDSGPPWRITAGRFARGGRRRRRGAGGSPG